MDACLDAGLKLSGINAEVMPAQWEFQIGPAGPLEAADHLWVARWLLYRIAEDHGASAHARSEAGQGRLERRRRAHQLLDQGDARVATTRASRAAEALGEAPRAAHRPLRPRHRRAPDRASTRPARTRSSSYGVSDRGASVRIPWQVAKDKKGYIEDRRPCANIDPYVVTRLITNTVCAAIEAKK